MKKMGSNFRHALLYGLLVVKKIFVDNRENFCSHFLGVSTIVIYIFQPCKPANRLSIFVIKYIVTPQKIFCRAEKLKMKENRFGKKYCKIVLTGGPCAGKYGFFNGWWS